MRLNQRKANSVLRFRDAASGETILVLTTDAASRLFWSYRLYDSSASLVAECHEPTRLPMGLEVKSPGGEMLLRVPADAGAPVEYRLYNSRGFLTTASDGLRTQILGFLRIEDK